MVRQCSEESSAAELNLMIPCVRKPDCSTFKACMEESEKKARKLTRDRRMKTRVASLAEDIETKNWKHANDTCRLYSGENHPDFLKLCDQVQAGYIKSLQAELESQRDKLKVEPGAYGRCLDLKSGAKLISDEMAQQAQLLCREIEAAKGVIRAREEIVSTLSEGKGRVPYECSSVIKELERLGTDWSTKARNILKKECEQDLPRQLVQDHVEDLSRMRDSGDTRDGFSKCFDLKRLTKSLAEEEQAKARALCDEVDAADDVKQAHKEAQRAINNQVAKIPFKCGWSLGKLEKLKNREWAKAQLAKLSKACYVGVGLFVLQARAERMNVCEFEVRKVLDGLAKYQLSDPSIDELVQIAKAKCP
jgi:hypothetical protein